AYRPPQTAPINAQVIRPRAPPPVSSPNRPQVRAAVSDPARSRWGAWARGLWRLVGFWWAVWGKGLPFLWGPGRRGPGAGPPGWEGTETAPSRLRRVEAGQQHRQLRARPICSGLDG